MNKYRSVTFTGKLIKLVGILLAVSIFVLGLYFASSIHVKRNIEANLIPIIEELKQTASAESVDINICADPSSYRLPWREDFHVFLTVNLDDLRRLSETEALRILNNGVELGSWENSYDWELTDYAIYTRSVADGVTGQTYPVFVTLSDGTRNYSIAEVLNKNALRSADAYETLRPPKFSKMLTISAIVSVLLLCLLGYLIYLKVRDSIALRNEQRGSGVDEVRRKKPKVQRKFILIVAGSVVAVTILAIAVLSYIVLPTIKYNNAIALKESGEIDAAYAIFDELGSFKDCDAQRNEIDYSRAEKFIADEYYKEAYLLLSQITEHEDSQDLMKQLEQIHPEYLIMLSSPGDIVTLGEYEQDGVVSNGKEPIEWIVLHNGSGDVYLLSKYILDAQQFNEEDKKECSLDDWLKTTFSKTAFENVSSDIITRVGILQNIDIDNYGMTEDQIKAEYTPFALSQNPETGYKSGLMWWVIEDTLMTTNGHISAPVVWEDGSHGSYMCAVTDRCGVRPAIWLFADSDEIPSEPIFDGSRPIQWRPSGPSDKTGVKRSICPWCGGDGKTHDWGTEKHGSGYRCSKCDGDGWLEYEGN